MLIEAESLRISPTACLFEGATHGAAVSFFLVEYPPGVGARLHVHPEPEVFVIQEGEAAFTIDGEEIRARAGQIVIAPANKPHRLLSIGKEPFRSVNLVPSGSMSFTWLGDEKADRSP